MKSGHWTMDNAHNGSLILDNKHWTIDIISHWTFLDIGHFMLEISLQLFDIGQ